MGVHKMSFKDGEDENGKVLHVDIKLVSNGYVLTIEFDEDIDELEEVYLDKKEAITRLKELL